MIELATWTLARSCLIALIAVVISAHIVSVIRLLPKSYKRLSWGVLMLTFFMPGLFLAYAYANRFTNLVHSPTALACLYSGLMALKLVPIGVVTHYFQPKSRLSESARHCRALATNSHSAPTVATFKNRIRFLWLGPVRDNVFPFALCCLLAFQEFELASLLGVNTWTVKLFDWHAGGLPLKSSLLLALTPALISLTLLLPLMIRNDESSQNPSTMTASSNQVFHHIVFIGYLVIALITIFILPFVFVADEMIGGFRQLLTSPIHRGNLTKEISFSLLSGTLAAIASYGAAVAVARTTVFKVPFYATAMIGLTGPLVTGLVVLSLVQWIPIAVIRESFVPTVFALTLMLLPMAMILKWLESDSTFNAQLHAAHLLATGRSKPARRNAGRLVWGLHISRSFWSVVLLAWWAYIGVIIPALLAPVGTTAAPVRLYNLMHYGRNGVLSAMTVFVILFPTLFVLLTYLLQRLSLRWTLR